MTNYLSISQTAAKHSLSRKWVLVLAKRPDSGAIRVGHQWQLPDTWTPPKVPRGRRKGEKQNRKKARR